MEDYENENLYDLNEYIIEDYENYQYNTEGYKNFNPNSGKDIEMSDDDIKYNEYIVFIKNCYYNKNFTVKPQYIKKQINEPSKQCLEILKISNFTPISPLEVFYKVLYDTENKISQCEDTCVICMDSLYESITKDIDLNTVLDLEISCENKFNIIMLDKCYDHFFHIECVYNLLNSSPQKAHGFNDSGFIKCPVCQKTYGIVTGNQPPGTMTVNLNKNMRCAGYENYETFCINYVFPSTNKYSGTARIAYLPNNKEGREVLALLKVAFDRKLIFTVGTSVTTGQTNTTVWGGIHHKTNLTGGTARFGYPDSTYFNRVKEEMASRGVTLESINQDPEEIVKNLIKEKIINKNMFGFFN